MDSYGVSNNYDYTEISLDSEDHSGGQNSLFTALNWPLFEVGGMQTMTKIVAFKIISAEIPFSYYLFNTRNNVFEIDPDDEASALITITPGNYTSSQMITELNTQIGLAGFGSGYTVTYSSTTQKFTFTCDGAGGTTDFTVTFGTAGGTTNTDAHWFLGFNSGVNASTLLVLESPNVILLSGPNYIYINSQNQGQLTNNILPTGAENLGGGNRGPQMAKVPVTSGPGSIIFYNDPAPEFWFNVGFIDVLQTMDFYLTLGNFAHPIDLNGLSFQIKLGVLKQKKSIDTSSMGGFKNNFVTHRSTTN
jgi:hypothetical protein